MVEEPLISIAAIDNGLSFPFKHPDAWRACMYIIHRIYLFIDGKDSSGNENGIGIAKIKYLW